MLGFNTIQLMPQMPFPWYTVYHYDDLHGTYGGASDEELKDFISTAKSLGLRVILDIVVHGVADAQSRRVSDKQGRKRRRRSTVTGESIRSGSATTRTAIFTSCIHGTLISTLRLFAECSRNT